MIRKVRKYNLFAVIYQWTGLSLSDMYVWIMVEFNKSKISSNLIDKHCKYFHVSFFLFFLMSVKESTLWNDPGAFYCDRKFTCLSATSKVVMWPYRFHDNSSLFFLFFCLFFCLFLFFFLLFFVLNCRNKFEIYSSQLITFCFDHVNLFNHFNHGNWHTKLNFWYK